MISLKTKRILIALALSVLAVISLRLLTADASFDDMTMAEAADDTRQSGGATDELIVVGDPSGSPRCRASITRSTLEHLEKMGIRRWSDACNHALGYRTHLAQ